MFLGFFVGKREMFLAKFVGNGKMFARSAGLFPAHFRLGRRCRKGCRQWVTTNDGCRKKFAVLLAVWLENSNFASRLLSARR